MNNLEDILKLLKAMANLPFESMEVTSADVTVKVSRGSAAAPAAAVSAPARTEQRAEPMPALIGPEEQGSGGVAVVSPIIGVFYAAPSPDDAPFVKVGDRVSAGQTLCIVEAMKLMNEIPSPVTGTVVRVLAKEGGEVEVGQPLFLVEAEG